MSYSVKGTNVTITRGDAFSANICIYQPNGKLYNLVEGDIVQFAMKKSTKDTTILILKDIPKETMKLVLNPDDTKELDFGTYMYDIQLKKATGEVHTFITKSYFTVVSSEVLNGSIYYASGSRGTGTMPNIGSQNGDIDIVDDQATIQQGCYDGSGNIKLQLRLLGD